MKTNIKVIGLIKGGGMILEFKGVTYFIGVRRSYEANPGNWYVQSCSDAEWISEYNAVECEDIQMIFEHITTTAGKVKREKAAA